MENVIERVISEELAEALHTIVYTGNINNATKVESMKIALAPLGFEWHGTGTNRVVFTHCDYDNLVFKFAVDYMGIKDNNAEMRLSNEEEVLSEYIVECFENIGTVLTQLKADMVGIEPYGTVDRFNELKIYKKYIKPVLEKLVGLYVLDDVGKDKYNNWGWMVKEDGELRPIMIDYAYLYPTSECDLRCNRYIEEKGGKCGAMMEYNKKLTHFKCPVCGSKKTFSKARIPRSDIQDKGTDFSNETL